MPTYEYRCPSGHDSEHFFRKISDAPMEVLCPVCGAEAVRRVSGGAGLLFKGSGFYLTDYGKNAHRKPSSDTSKSDGKSEGKAESTKSESAGSSAGTSESGSPTKPDAAKASESKPSSTKSPGGETK